MNSTTEAPESPTTPGQSKSVKIVFALVSIVAVIALVAAVFFGVGWARTLLGDKPTADTRDAALEGAQQAAINLASVDAANIDESFDTMETSVTGDEMLNFLEQTRIGISDDIRNSGGRITAEVLNATLTELNTDDETATALVVLANTTTMAGDTQRAKVTMRMSMQDVDGIWKANQVSAVGNPISLDAPADTPTGPAPEIAPGAPADPEAPAAPAPEPGDTEGP